MHIQYKDRLVMRFYSRKRDVIIDSPQRYVGMFDEEHDQIYDRTNSFCFFIICRLLSEWKFKKTKTFELSTKQEKRDTGLRAYILHLNDGYGF